MTLSTTGRACVAEPTASAKQLYTVRCHEGTLTQSKLVTTTGLNRETVKRSVVKLVDCGVATETVDLTDGRRTQYEPVSCHC